MLLKKQAILPVFVIHAILARGRYPFLNKDGLCTVRLRELRRKLKKIALTNLGRQPIKKCPGVKGFTPTGNAQNGAEMMCPSPLANVYNRIENLKELGPSTLSYFNHVQNYL